MDTPKTAAGRALLFDADFHTPTCPRWSDIGNQAAPCSCSLPKAILAIEAEAAQPAEGLHIHPLYDCGGKRHGSDVSEVQWCHDCTPHAAQPADGLDVERLAQATEGHLSGGCTPSECVPKIAAEYARLAATTNDLSTSVNLVDADD